MARDAVRLLNVFHSVVFAASAMAADRLANSAIAGASDNLGCFGGSFPGWIVGRYGCGRRWSPPV